MKNEHVIEYWLAHYLRDGHCSLCGNVGIIDTRATARTPAGFYCGDVHYCICPNGQSARGNIPALVALENYKRMNNRIIKS